MSSSTDVTKSQKYNELKQPVGEDIANWRARARPPETSMEGRYCDVVRLDATAHAKPLYDAICDDVEGRHWTYLFVDGFNDFESFNRWLVGQAANKDPMVFAVIDKQSAKAIGIASFMRMDPSHGSIEVGGIYFSPRLQKTPLATEAMYLMMQRVFDELGYRRYEWKCDSCNEPSKKAAARFGFTYEGLFRQAIVYKGRNRDTAWFSIIDSEWPAQRLAFQSWLDPSNFDEHGLQRMALSEFMRNE